MKVPTCHPCFLSSHPTTLNQRPASWWIGKEDRPWLSFGEENRSLGQFLSSLPCSTTIKKKWVGEAKCSKVPVTPVTLTEPLMCVVAVPQKHEVPPFSLWSKWTPSCIYGCALSCTPGRTTFLLSERLQFHSCLVFSSVSLKHWNKHWNNICSKKEMNNNIRKMWSIKYAIRSLELDVGFPQSAHLCRFFSFSTSLGQWDLCPCSTT